MHENSMAFIIEELVKYLDEGKYNSFTIGRANDSIIVYFQDKKDFNRFDLSLFSSVVVSKRYMGKIKA